MNISYLERIPNEEVRRKIQKDIEKDRDWGGFITLQGLRLFCRSKLNDKRKEKAVKKSKE